MFLKVAHNITGFLQRPGRAKGSEGLMLGGNSDQTSNFI